jgi:hypothetical protein
MRMIADRVARLNEVNAEVQLSANGNVRFGDIEAVLDLTGGPNGRGRYLATACNEDQAKILRQAFTFVAGDPPRIVFSPEAVADNAELMQAFREMQRNIYDGHHLSTNTRAKTARILNLAISSTITFGFCWVSVGRAVEAVARIKRLELKEVEIFWIRNAISAGSFAIANQFFHPAFDILEVLMGGATRPRNREDVGQLMQMFSVFASQEAGAVLALGVVLGGIAALPEFKNNIGNAAIDITRFFPAFALWAAYQEVVERYLTRRPQGIELASTEDEQKSFARKVKQAAQGAWNEAIGGSSFRRNMVQIIAKYLATLSLPPTVAALAVAITGSANPVGSSAWKRFQHLFAVNAAFVGELFVLAIRLVALIYLIRENTGGRLAGTQASGGSSSGASGSRHRHRR